MAALTLGLALLAATPPTNLPVDPVAIWSAPIAEAALRFAIPEDWIRRVMRAESGGRTMLGGRPIRSPVGAIGLMQLMPATWAEMRDLYHLGADPDDPDDNILAGAAYLRTMYGRFGYPGLFAAYNAGPARYAASLVSGRRLPSETLAYLTKLTRMSDRQPAGSSSPPSQMLFAVRHDRIQAVPQQALDVEQSSLFAVRSVVP